MKYYTEDGTVVVVDGKYLRVYKGRVGDATLIMAKPIVTLVLDLRKSEHIDLRVIHPTPVEPVVVEPTAYEVRGVKVDDPEFELTVFQNYLDKSVSLPLIHKFGSVPSPAGWVLSGEGYKGDRDEVQNYLENYLEEFTVLKGYPIPEGLPEGTFALVWKT